MFKENDSPVPGYRLLKKLGRGQYGVVWAAEGPGGTRVALKFIPIEDAKGEIELKAIRYVKLIRHTNLIPIHAVWILDKEGKQLDGAMLDEAVPATEGETLVADPLEGHSDLGHLVVCMTLADGSLEDLLKDAKKEGNHGLPEDQVLDYMTQAAQGLDFLNDQRHQVGEKTVGIQHRDIKPANLLLVGDAVVIGDFGVATTMKNFHHTATTALGSLAFMAPESISRRPAKSSDQYALAITYYQLRTGKLPFSSDVSLPELVNIHQKGILDFSLVSQAEQTVLKKGTHKDPKLRFDSCRALVEELKSSISGASSQPRTLTPILVVAGVIALISIPIVYMMTRPANPDPMAINTQSTDSETNENPAVPDNQTKYRLRCNLDLIISATVISNDIESEPVTGQGELDLFCFEKDKIKVAIEPESPFHLPFTKTFTLEELGQIDWTIEIPTRSIAEVRSAIQDLLANGEEHAAKKMLQDAFRHDQNVVSLPSPVITSLPFKAFSGCVLDNNKLVLGAERSNTLSLIEATNESEAKVTEVLLDEGLSNSFIQTIAPLESKQALVFRSDAIQMLDETESGPTVNEFWRSEEDEFLIDGAYSLSQSKKRFAAGYAEGHVKIWKLDEQQKPDRIETFTDQLLLDVELVDDGLWILGERDGEIELFQMDSAGVESTKISLSPTVIEAKPTQLASHSGYLLLLCEKGCYCRNISDEPTSWERLSETSSPNSVVCSSSDGRFLLVDKTLVEFGQQSIKASLELSSSVERISSAMFLRDDQTCVVLDQSGTIHMVRPTQNELQTLTVYEHENAISLSLMRPSSLPLAGFVLLPDDESSKFVWIDFNDYRLDLDLLLESSTQE